ncbi:hypothetical protein BSZ19_21900 [Bradyrhizobium japonicum]|uniref:Uncharacterized protein n=1 Tax=Bradyrhizobium japonicum TaxID=375 RepID=A0A1Y2JNE3_BRAJP|nr:hypothetical protein [Bradyrhizobium japonicum]OSJ31541.1 hypothetical protein BSZ19_21900 [Bradyrhizobium japonicum]
MAIVNITTQNDADFIRQFAYQTVSGVPIDLTGNKLRMGVRRHAEDVAEQMLLTTENGGLEISDAVNGKFTVWIKQDDLERQQLGDYDHSLIRFPPTGMQLRIWSGLLTINAGPSR